MCKIASMTLLPFLILCPGCIRSLHPIYTEQDIVFEWGLIGEWGRDNSKETWAFSRKGTSQYKLVCTDGDGKQGVFSAHLTKIKGKLFLDFFPAELELKENDFFRIHLVPVHTFAHVKQIEPTLQMSFPNPDWLKEHLAANPNAIHHEKIEDEIILTAATKDLQAFWLKHLDSEGAFGEPNDMKRKPNKSAEAAMERAVAAQKECSKRLQLPVEITNSIEMKLKLMPAGEFMMGSTKSPLELVRMFDLAKKSAKEFTREHPQHKVRITKPFYLGVYEVTQEQYEKVMGKNPSSFKGASNPVEKVSWDDAVEFCKRLSAKEGKTYRLPTEAEWEYAFRAGSTTLYSFGDDPARLGEHAWHWGNSDRKTHPVGEKKPNVWGLYDMHGNVWEWCADSWTGSCRVRRGGSWFSWARYCRSACRNGRPPSYRSSIQGFRVAADPPGGQPGTSPAMDSS